MRFRQHHAPALADPATPPIKRLRIERGLTLAEAAAASGCGSYQQVWRCENGLAGLVSAENRRRLAEFYGVAPEAIQ